MMLSAFRSLSRRALSSRRSLVSSSSSSSAAAPADGQGGGADPFVLYLRKYRAMLVEMLNIPEKYVPKKVEDVPAYSDQVDIILKKMGLPMDAGLKQLTDHLRLVSRGATTAREKFELGERERKRLGLGVDAHHEKIAEAIARAEKAVGGEVILGNKAHQDALKKELAVARKQIPDAFQGPGPRTEAWYKAARVAALKQSFNKVADNFRLPEGTKVPPDFEALRGEFPWSLLLPHPENSAGKAK